MYCAHHNLVYNFIPKVWGGAVAEATRLRGWSNGPLSWGCIVSRSCTPGTDHEQGDVLCQWRKRQLTTLPARRVAVSLDKTAKYSLPMNEVILEAFILLDQPEVETPTCAARWFWCGGSKVLCVGRRFEASR